MNAPTNYIDEAMQAPDPRTSQRLFGMGVVALVVATLVLAHESRLEDGLLITVGALVMALGALPALVWSKRAEPHFPTFEMFMLTTIPFYAVPLISGRKSEFNFTDDATWQAALSLIVFQVCANITFLAVKGKPVNEPKLTVTLLPQAAIRYAQAGIWLTTAYFYIRGFTDWIPYEISNTVRAIFFGIGTVALFVLARRWGARQLHVGEKVVVVLNVAVQLIILFRDLYLITGISVVLLGLIGYVSTSRRVPVLLIAILLPIVAVLHSGKSTMRVQYWVERKPAPTLGELPGFFQTWIEAGLNPKADESEAEATVTGRLFERASLFQMLCLVTERTPTMVDYLAGESYIYVPAQLVPSFMWPGKPSSLLSNILLAVHYGLVPADSTTSVSIAFGMVAEAYANFGLLGCASLGALLGFAFKKITAAAVGCPQFSAMGLLTILLAAWSFQAEQIFATWFISLIQAAVVVIGVPIVIRLLFRQD